MKSDVSGLWTSPPLKGVATPCKRIPLWRPGSYRQAGYAGLDFPLAARGRGPQERTPHTAWPWPARGLSVYRCGGEL